MEIEHSGFELSMTHVALDDPQVDTGFEEMGGIGMAQGVNGDTFLRTLHQTSHGGKRPGHHFWP